MRRHARQLNVERERTGGGVINHKPLSSIEERILTLISKVTIEGAEGVPEIGITVNDAMVFLLFFYYNFFF